MHPSGFPARWNGTHPMLYVLERHFDPKKGETAENEGYERYMQLPFFSFVAQLRSQGVPMGPLQENGSYPVMFTEEHVKKTREEFEKQQSLEQEHSRNNEQTTKNILLESNEVLLPATPLPLLSGKKPTKKAKLSKLQRRAKELEEENERALDEAYQKNMEQKKLDEAFEDCIGKALAYNFRSDTMQLLHNPHYLLPSFPPQSNKVQHLSECVEKREFLVMNIVHQTIAVLRAFPNQALCSSQCYDPLMRIITQNGLCLDPTSGEADSFFKLPTATEDCNETLAMAKFLHIVRLPMCATISLRQLLHPAVFPSGYPTPSFPHVLYDQLAQKFYRSMSLRHLTLAIHSPDILFLFDTLPEFTALVKGIETLEWFIGEVEFDAHRSFFSPPPGGFLKDLSGDFFNKLLQHFLVQLTVSDRLKIPMAPFVNKPGLITYESFSSDLIQKLETWRPCMSALSAHVAIPSSIFYSALKADGSFTEFTQNSASSSTFCGRWSSKSGGNKESSGLSSPDLLKNLFMCCLGAQTEMSSDFSCSYREASEFTLRFFLHPPICKVWNERFLLSEPREILNLPPQRTLTLANVWKNVLQLPLQTSSSNVWKNSRVCCELAFRRRVE
jgi:hypothetical protein